MTSRETLLVIPKCLILIIELHKDNKRNFIMFRILRELKKICRINLSLLTRPLGRINLSLLTRPLGRMNLSLATRPLCQVLVRATFLLIFSSESSSKSLLFLIIFIKVTNSYNGITKDIAN